MTYDAVGDRLFIVKERDPRQLYEVRGVAASLDGQLQLAVHDRSDWIASQVFATDLSDIHFDAETGHLILLSDESRLVMELGADGRMLSYRSLNGLFSDLGRSAPQPEGVTTDNDGTLYVVSERTCSTAARRSTGIPRARGAAGRDNEAEHDGEKASYDPRLRTNAAQSALTSLEPFVKKP